MIHRFKHKDMYFVLDVNSGAVHIIDEVVYDVLEYYPEISGTDIKILTENHSKKDIDEAIEDIDELIAKKELFCPEDIDLIQMEKEFRDQKVVKALCLHVAHDCNLRCKYCFASQGNFQCQSLLMPLETGKRALELIAKNSGKRVNLEVDFFGGEPLMNFDVVKELVSYGRTLEPIYNKKFRFTITTNGTLLNQERTNYINQNMDNVVLSIDGRKQINDLMRPTTSGAGSYDLILQKYKDLVSKRLKQKNKNYFVRGTFTSQNIDFSEDVKHLVDEGFNSVSVEPVVAEETDFYALKESDLPKLFEEYDELAEDVINRTANLQPYNFFHFEIDLNQGPCAIKRVTGCGAGSEYIAVTPEGDIYPCHQFVGKNEFIMGNVNDEKPYKTDDKFGAATVYNKPKCKECWAKFYCSGGCHANAFNFNNDIMVPYELGCELEKKRIECSIYIKGRLLV